MIPCFQEGCEEASDTIAKLWNGSAGCCYEVPLCEAHAQQLMPRGGTARLAITFHAFASLKLLRLRSD